MTEQGRARQALPQAVPQAAAPGDCLKRCRGQAPHHTGRRTKAAGDRFIREAPGATHEAAPGANTTAEVKGRTG